MPYISSERVKEVREQFKKEFPDFKFSIRTIHHSTIDISVLEGTIDFKNKDGNAHVNHFWLQDHWNGEALAFLSRVKEIANEGNRIISEDGDYGSIPKFYLDISIGKYGKPYKLVAKKSKKEKPVTSSEPVNTSDIKMVDYNNISFALVGEGTKAIKDKLGRNGFGGRWNKWLKDGNGGTFAGWIFSKAKSLAAVEAFLGMKLNAPEETPAVAEPIMTPERRKPAYENIMTRAAGLMATCNNCDRIIFDDENWMSQYTACGGYCKKCFEESNEPADPDNGHFDYLKESDLLKSFDINEVPAESKFSAADIKQMETEDRHEAKLEREYEESREREGSVFEYHLDAIKKQDAKMPEPVKNMLNRFSCISDKTKTA